MTRTGSRRRAAVAALAGAAVVATLGVAVTTESAQAAGGSGSLPCVSTRGRFVPTHAVISHIGRVTVLAVGHAADGAMGTPPLTDTGKHQLAWYNASAEPGSGHGGVAMDAHTWPDGTALGNQLAASLVKGDTIVLADAGNRHRTCYRVTAREQYPDSAVPMRRIVQGTGKGQILSLVVCSGTRLGPGDWTARTVWTAKPVAPPKPKPAPKPAPTPAPTPAPKPGGLLGLGIL